jgi:hypothetical protein
LFVVFVIAAPRLMFRCKPRLEMSFAPKLHRDAGQFPRRDWRLPRRPGAVKYRQASSDAVLACRAFQPRAAPCYVSIRAKPE